MPLREYSCHACGREFEELVSEGEKPRCPGCGGRRLTRLFSAFAVATSGGRPKSAEPGACGSCGDPRGAGACSLDD